MHVHCEEGYPAIVGYFQWNLYDKRVGNIEVAFMDYSESKKV